MGESDVHFPTGRFSLSTADPTLTAPPSFVQRISLWSCGRSARLFTLVSIIAIVLLILAIMAIHRSIQQSARVLVRQSLLSTLHSNVRSLQNWRQGIEAETERICAIPEVNSAAIELLGVYGTRPELLRVELINDITAKKLKRTLENAAGPNKFIGWGIVDLQGRVLASSFETFVGERLSIPDDSLEKIISRKVTLTRPFRSPLPFAKDNSLAKVTPPLMASMAPISEGARSLGSLVYLHDPRDDFSHLLSANCPGQSGSTYAIDRRGYMISATCNDEQLRELGLITPEPTSTPILNLRVCEPISKMEANRSKQLTLLADQLSRGATGENLVGYRDYRGVDVIGAWHWLPEEGFGVATEIDLEDAFAAIAWLKFLTGGIIGALSLLLAGIAVLRIFGSRFSKSVFNFATTRQLGRYKLGRKLGEGAMGTVYLGVHEMLRREVAIKVLEKEELTSTTASRFAREVQATARLRHPNTIAIYDYGQTEEGTFFYVMEFLRGLTLQELIDQYGRQRPDRVIALMLQICGSLSEAHSRGLVHRDVKPANIFLTSLAGNHDYVKVLDFGLVKEVTRDTVQITQTDSITGTPMYMSPEAVRDASRADAKSDLYAVGAIGYALLTGVPVFDSGSSVEVCLKQLNEDPLRPSDRIGAELPIDLQNVLMSCLRKDPAQRPMSMDELADTLRHCQDHGGWTHADSARWWTETYDGFLDNGPVVINSEFSDPDSDGSNRLLDDADNTTKCLVNNET